MTPTEKLSAAHSTIWVEGLKLTSLLRAADVEQGDTATLHGYILREIRKSLKAMDDAMGAHDAAKKEAFADLNT